MRVPIAVRLAACGMAAVAVMPSFATVAVAANPAVNIDDAASCLDGSEFCYRPASLTVAAGTTVTVTNSSMANHSLTRCTVSACGSGNTGDGSQNFDTGVLSNGSSAPITLNQPGTYVYYCTVHGYSVMHGSFTVTAASSPGAQPTTSASPSPSAASAPTPAPMPAAHVAATAIPSTGADVNWPAGALLVGAGVLMLLAVQRRRD
jgi:plastocyanin